MICAIKCCGECATRWTVAADTSTIPWSVSTPGRIRWSAPGPSNKPIRMYSSPSNLKPVDSQSISGLALSCVALKKFWRQPLTLANLKRLEPFDRPERFERSEAVERFEPLIFVSPSRRSEQVTHTRSDGSDWHATLWGRL